MNKILVPVDGSAASEKAAIKAVNIARKYGGDIVFLSVADVRGKFAYMGDGVVTLPVNHAQISAILLENQTKMLDVFEGIVNTEGVKVEKKVLVGVPYEEIIKYADENKTDLIIMSRRGYSKVRRFFVGSITQRVIADAPCPVLVINEDDQ
ncbi:putative universal stress protein [bioreactor metagenome]|uniref:Putative universal stress protein n=1 Tax=bioreactor metagenome TaxID=1076179 RepID=A0A644XBP7_9ZZZZ